MESTTTAENTSYQEDAMNQSMTIDPLDAGSQNTIPEYPLVMLFVQIAVGSIIVVLNVVTGVGLVRCRGTNKLLMMLLIFQALSDTFVGLMFIYLPIFRVIMWFNVNACIVRYILSTVTSTWSLVTVTMISVERILAIRFPYKHQDTTSSVLLMTSIGLCCWLGPIILVVIEFQFINRNITGCNMLFLFKTTVFAVHGGFGIALNIIIVICNTYLFKTSLAHIRKIVPTFVGTDKLKQAVRLNLKATLTSASVVIPFIILNLPNYVLFVMLWINPSLRFESETRSISFLVYSLVAINSALNPIMYTWRMKELRNKIKRQFRIRTRQVRNT